MNLTKNFTLEELTQSQEARRRGLDNTPPPDVLAELRWTAVGLESIRRLLGDKPMTISSGYRCEPLERAITDRDFRAWCARRSLVADDRAWASYFASKQHPKGQAADFICPAFGAPADIIRAIVTSGCIGFDQLIAEYGQTGWVHVSFVKDNPRGQVLKIDATGTRPFFPRG